ncbi:MAG: 4'-phosphopantetheinyl transferase superfamily protein [Acidiferrobacterales bacterium]|nr:4'-phosphopantetheinyl transferase superfamily protein [Acidiferrobacterales bacterium]
MLNEDEDLWFRCFCEVADVSVVHVDLTPNKSREERAFSQLDKSERERWHRYKFSRPQREFALCRAALRMNLCHRLDCDNRLLSFDNFEYGKPFALIDGVAVQTSFNLSHSGMHGLIAFASEGRVGVDVEERIDSNDFDGIGKIVFGEQEQTELSSRQVREKPHFFYTLWTLKEALIKALGTGFSLDPSRFQVPPSMRHGARSATFRFPHLPDIFWKLEDMGNTDFAAAIAHELVPAIARIADE